MMGVTLCKILVHSHTHTHTHTHTHALRYTPKHQNTHSNTTHTHTHIYTHTFSHTRTRTHTHTHTHTHEPNDRYHSCDVKEPAEPKELEFEIRIRLLFCYHQCVDSETEERDEKKPTPIVIMAQKENCKYAMHQENQSTRNCFKQ